MDLGIIPDQELDRFMDTLVRVNQDSFHEDPLRIIDKYDFLHNAFMSIDPLVVEATSRHKSLIDKIAYAVGIVVSKQLPLLEEMAYAACDGRGKYMIIPAAQAAAALEIAYERLQRYISLKPVVSEE
jgi:hypothetical protein